jgi:hypothetical protein
VPCAGLEMAVLMLSLSRPARPSGLTDVACCVPQGCTALRRSTGSTRRYASTRGRWEEGLGERKNRNAKKRRGISGTASVLISLVWGGQGGRWDLLCDAMPGFQQVSDRNRCCPLALPHASSYWESAIPRDLIWLVGSSWRCCASPSPGWRPSFVRRCDWLCDQSHPIVGPATCSHATGCPGGVRERCP